MILIKKKKNDNLSKRKRKRATFLNAHYVPDTLHTLSHLSALISKAAQEEICFLFTDEKAAAQRS